MAYNFPDAPTVGQGYSGYVWDGEKWLAIAGPPNMSGVISIQVFTVNGSYVPSANMTTCLIECVGGGGGGGGVVGVVTASVAYSGGGGGAGGYSRKQSTAAIIGSSQVVTIGTGGSGGATGANNGSAGNDTSVGTLCIAKGGSGGLYGGQAQVGLGGAGGIAGTGDVAATGQSGGGGIYVQTTQNASVTSNFGGSTLFGGGARGTLFSGGAAVAGNAATANSGGGGSGATAQTVGANAAGGNGGSGFVVITEYGMIALSSANAQGMVRFDLPQTLTANQTAQARANIWVTKKNYIINGGMQISQENGATVVTGTATFPVDQFSCGLNTTGTVQQQQVASVTPGGSPNRIRYTAAVADTSIVAGDYYQIHTLLEGLRVADLRSGSASAKTVTVQFGVKAPAGTYSVAIRNDAFDRAYVAEYVIAAGEANTDVVKSVTIPLDTIGTWRTDNGIGLRITWGLMGGTTYQQTPNTWLAGSGYTTANQFNFLGTVNNIFELFDVSLTEGTVAPPFQLPDYAQELALCQRYYEKNLSTSSTVRWSGTATSGFSHEAVVFFKGMKRAAPTVVAVSSSATSFPATSGTIGTDQYGFIEARVASATGFGRFTSDWTANARL